MLLGPAKYGTDLYGVEGIYTSKATGEQISAGLLFEVRSGRATLQNIWGFPKGKQAAQPFELSPVAGDTFVPLLRSYTVKGDRLVPDFVQGDPIIFGDQPLSALQVPANRFGFGEFTATQLKVMQEVISLSVFAVFAWLYFGEAPTWRTGLAFTTETGKVLDLGPHSFIRSGKVSGQGQSDQWSQRIMPGSPIGTFFGPVFLGVDATTGFQVFQCSAATAGRVNGRTTLRGGPDAAPPSRSGRDRRPHRGIQSHGGPPGRAGSHAPRLPRRCFA